MRRHAHRIDAARAACAFALLAMLCSSPARAWWKDEWQYRKEITVDSGVSALAARAGVAEIVIPVRLHAGNFGYFGDTLPDGADLRFVAGDDATPLDVRVERYDPAIGVAVVWVRIPVTQLATASHVWMYYGNERATSVASSAIEDAQTVLSYDFAEKSGPPRDGTAYAAAARACCTVRPERAAALRSSPATDA
jgi:biopolymer transport protein ExbB